MAVNNVSTFGSLQSLLQNMSTIQNSLNTQQQQLSSGQVSQTFDGISGSVEQLTSVNSQVTRLNGYSQGNTNIIAQMNVSNTVLGQVSQLATSVKSRIGTHKSGVSSNASFVQQLQSQMGTLSSLLNSTYNSNYLFGGSDISTAPVKTPVPAPTQIGTPDDNYYQGTNQDVTFRISDSQTITPNVRANDPAFQNLFAGIRQAIAAASGGVTDASAALTNAENLVDQGTQGVNALQASVNTNILTVQQVNSQNQQVLTYFKGIVSNISSADVVSISTQVAQDTSILQASFSAFARISQLTLSNYLK